MRVAEIDQPMRMRSAGLEVLSIDPVPVGERHGRVRDQFTMWFGLNANIFPVVLGGLLVLNGMPVGWASVAIVLGVLSGLLFVGFHAIQGPRLGVPQMIQSRAQFGFYGAVLVFLASIVLDFGFLAAQLVIQADAMHLLLGGISVPVWIAVIAVPVLVMTVFGHDWLHQWQRGMSVLLACTFLILCVRIVSWDPPTAAPVPSGLPSAAAFMAGASVFVIAVVSWAPYVSDYSRYLPQDVSRVRVFWAVYAGAAVPQIACAVVGAYLTSLLPRTDSTVSAIGEVGGKWMLLVMALSLIGSDVANAYTGMLSVVSIVSCFRTVHKSVRLRVLGSVLLVSAGTLSALLGYRQFVDDLSDFLNVLLYVFIPWSAINLTDYYLVRRGKYDVASLFSPDRSYPGFIWPGLVAYLLAVLIQLPFIDQTYFTGPLVGALGDIDIAWIVGGVTGVVLYLVALRISAHAPSRW